jgi:hypothetical protein
MQIRNAGDGKGGREGAHLKEDVPDEVERHPVTSEEQESKFRRSGRRLELKVNLGGDMAIGGEEEDVAELEEGEEEEEEEAEEGGGGCDLPSPAMVVADDALLLGHRRRRLRRRFTEKSVAAGRRWRLLLRETEDEEDRDRRTDGEEGEGGKKGKNKKIQNQIIKSFLFLKNKFVNQYINKKPFQKK